MDGLQSRSKERQLRVIIDLMEKIYQRGSAHESSGLSKVRRPGSINSLGNVLRSPENSIHFGSSIRSWETDQGFNISESQGLKISKSPSVLPRFTELRGRRIKAVQNLPGFWRKLCRKSGDGRLTRNVVIAGLGVSVGAPVVAAAFASWGTDAAAVLNQMGAFGAGYFTNLVSDWLKRNPKSNPANEDTVRMALSDMLIAVESVTENLSDEEALSESLQHLAALLADPVVLGMIMTIAATNGQELRALKPFTDGAPNDSADDDWLLEEVVEILEDLARQPGVMETALVEVYASLVETNSHMALLNDT
jgi:hypothetical protein